MGAPRLRRRAAGSTRRRGSSRRGCRGSWPALWPRSPRRSWLAAKSPCRTRRPCGGSSTPETWTSTRPRRCTERRSIGGPGCPSPRSWTLTGPASGTQPTVLARRRILINGVSTVRTLGSSPPSSRSTGSGGAWRVMRRLTELLSLSGEQAARTWRATHGRACSTCSSTVSSATWRTCCRAAARSRGSAGGSCAPGWSSTRAA
mmetsp:Transcript_36660/g.105520  ORF Transcript_36660/g.105520 Transcript_36660/m.105520 type:complete len:203 (-) Transcript_36660:344-952(-)